MPDEHRIGPSPSFVWTFLDCEDQDNVPRGRPQQRLRLTDGEPLMSPWRQQPGIGHLTAGDLPDVVVQDRASPLATTFCGSVY